MARSAPPGLEVSGAEGQWVSRSSPGGRQARSGGPTAMTFGPFPGSRPAEESTCPSRRHSPCLSRIESRSPQAASC